MFFSAKIPRNILEIWYSFIVQILENVTDKRPKLLGPLHCWRQSCTSTEWYESIIPFHMSTWLTLQSFNMQQILRNTYDVQIQKYFSVFLTY